MKNERLRPRPIYVTIILEANSKIERQVMIEMPFNKENHYAFNIPDTDWIVMKLWDFHECCHKDEHGPNAPEHLLLDDEHVIVPQSNYDDLVCSYPDKSEMFVLEMPVKGAYAEARIALDPDEPWIVVFAGAEIGKAVLTMKEQAKRKRRQLENEKVIVDGKLVKNYTFDNYSVAAGVITGDSVSGNVLWKQDGKTLKDLGIGLSHKRS